MKKKSVRGAALFFVLLVTLVMATLMGAFVTIHHQQLALSGDTNTRQLLHEACVSGLNYVQSKLEKNTRYGATSFANAKDSFPPGIGYLEITEVGDKSTAKGLPDTDKNYVEGRLSSAKGVEYRFKVRIVNNLEEYTPILTSKLGPVPARTVRIRVEGEVRGARRRLDAVLRRHPFSDSSIQSGRDIRVIPTVKGTGWRIASRDMTNLVRANGSVYGPDALADKLKFEGPRGQIRAHQEIYLNNKSVSSDASFKADSEARSGGTFAPNSKQMQIPDLKGSQLKLPPTQLDIDSGDYEFCTVKYNRWEPSPDQPGKWLHHIEEHSGLRTPANVLANKTPYGSTTELVDDKTGEDGWDDGVVTEVEERATLWNTTVKGVVKNVVADLTTGNILIPPGVTLKAPGYVRFGGRDGGQATLAFGFYEGDDNPSKFAADESSNPIAAMQELGAALSAEGDLLLDGPVIGLGSLNSEGSLTFSAQSGLSVSPNVAVAVRARDNLRIAPPAPSRLPVGLRADGPSFTSAIQAGGKWDALKSFSTMKYEDKEKLAAALLEQPIKDRMGNAVDAATAFDLIRRELDPGTSFPNFNSPPFSSDPGWKSTLTLDKWLRLREYVRTRHDDILSRPTVDIARMALGQLNTYVEWARSEGSQLEAFMKAGAVIPDMWFRGLVYAGGSVDVQANDNSFYNEGAVVAKGNIRMETSPDVSSVYNRLFLEDIVERYRGFGTKLDAIYFNWQ